MKHLLSFLIVCSMLFSCAGKDSDAPMKGVVLSSEDLLTLDWVALASQNGLNTLSVPIGFSQTEKGRDILRRCREQGILVDYQWHAMSSLLPRDLYASDSTLFRMDEHGNRNPESNCCVSSAKALDIIAANAVKYARENPPTNNRYYYWMDDGAPTCKCPECSKYNDSEKSLIVENRILRELRKTNPEAKVAHLAYYGTMEVPEKVKPEEGIFLEFAPFFRTWDAPLNDSVAKGRTGVTNKTFYDYLVRNLKVFDPAEVVVLEYWLDVSLVSDWKKPARKLKWDGDVFRKDIELYSDLGIKNIASFGVYIDSAYVAAYKDLSFLKEYGRGLKAIK